MIHSRGKPVIGWLCLLAACWVAPPAAWAGDLASTNGLPGASPQSPAGFWPTPRMIDSVVRRWAAEARQRYDLTPEQHAQVEKRLVRRWEGFLTANRGELQPLLNDYLETRLDIEPPTPEQVQAWAQRAMPVYQKLEREVEDGETEVRDLLNPTQRAEFDKRRTRRHLGLNYFKGNLQRWTQGQFVRAEWWDPPAGWREPDAAKSLNLVKNPPAQPNKAGRQDDQETETGLPSRVAGELDVWEKHVEDFCAHYALDRSQRGAAHSMLRELLARARDHVRLHHDRIVKLEKTIASEEPADPQAVERELDELYGPLDRMFQELDQRLNQLPTTNQRQHAESSQTP